MLYELLPELRGEDEQINNCGGGIDLVDLWVARVQVVWLKTNERIVDA